MMAFDTTAVPQQIADAYRRSAERGYVAYVSGRSLCRLFINEGFDPDREPGAYDYSVLDKQGYIIGF